MMPQIQQDQAPFPNRELIENIIIGSLLQDYSIVHIAQTHLKPEDFLIETNQIIFNAIIHCYHDQRQVDLVTVLNQLATQGITHDIISPIHLVRLTDQISSTVHFQDHVQILKEWAVRKQIHDLTIHVNDLIMEPTNATQQIIDEIYLKTGHISGRISDNQRKPTFDILTNMWDEIDKGLGKGTDITNIPDLNELIGGALPGDLIIIAGRPGAGKSVITSNIIKYHTDKQESCLMWSLEMANEYVLQRILSMMSDVHHERIITNAFSEHEAKQLEETQQHILDAGHIFIEKAAVSAQDIRSEIIYLKSLDHDIKTLIIDHGGLLNHINPNNQNTVEEIGFTSKLLKQTAKELGIKIILLWQLNRQAAKGVVPSLADLRGSGRLEEDADKVLFIHRPELYHNSGDTFEINGHQYPTKNLAVFILAKNRRGPVGSTIGLFTPETYKFSAYTLSADTETDSDLDFF